MVNTPDSKPGDQGSNPCAVAKKDLLFNYAYQIFHYQNLIDLILALARQAR